MVTSLAVIVMPRKTYLLIADTHTIIRGFFIAWTNQSVWSTDGEWWKEKTQCLFAFISEGNVWAILLSLGSGSLLWNVEQNNAAWPRNCTVSVATEVKSCCKQATKDKLLWYIRNLAHAFVFRITKNSRNANILILKIRSATRRKTDAKSLAVFQYSKAVLHPWELEWTCEDWTPHQYSQHQSSNFTTLLLFYLWILQLKLAQVPQGLHGNL